MPRTPIDIDKHVGATVRSRRMEIGMSQEKLAEILDVTFQQVQKYEKGVNRVAASRLYDIARALRMSVGDFFPVHASEAVSDADSAEWMAIWRRTDAKERPMLLAIAKATATAAKKAGVS